MKTSTKIFIAYLFVIASILTLVAGGYFIATRFGPDLHVKYSPSDLRAYEAKNGIGAVSGSATLADLMTGAFREEGGVAFDDYLTQEEITAAVNETSDRDGMLSDFAIRFHADGTIEMTFTAGTNFKPIYAFIPEVGNIGPYLRMATGCRIYYKFAPVLLEDGTFEAESLKTQLGLFEVQINQTVETMTLAGTAVNRAIRDLPALRIDEFEVLEGRIHVRGILPILVRTAS